MPAPNHYNNLQQEVDDEAPEICENCVPTRAAVPALGNGSNAFAGNLPAECGYLQRALEDCLLRVYQQQTASAAAPLKPGEHAQGWRQCAPELNEFRQRCNTGRKAADSNERGGDAGDQ